MSAKNQYGLKQKLKEIIFQIRHISYENLPGFVKTGILSCRETSKPDRIRLKESSFAVALSYSRQSLK